MRCALSALRRPLWPYVHRFSAAGKTAACPSTYSPSFEILPLLRMGLVPHSKQRYAAPNPKQTDHSEHSMATRCRNKHINSAATTATTQHSNAGVRTTCAAVMIGLSSSPEQWWQGVSVIRLMQVCRVAVMHRHLGLQHNPLASCCDCTGIKRRRGMCTAAAQRQPILAV